MGTYVVELRSAKPDQLGPVSEREFGGAGPRELLYRRDSVGFQAPSDKVAIQTARREARKRGMVVLEVHKVVYQRAFYRKKE